jgi:hypothetical protein
MYGGAVDSLARQYPFNRRQLAADLDHVLLLERAKSLPQRARCRSWSASPDRWPRIDRNDRAQMVKCRSKRARRVIGRS